MSNMAQKGLQEHLRCSRTGWEVQQSFWTPKSGGLGWSRRRSERRPRLSSA